MEAKRKRRFKRIVLSACWHCGHRSGLTPPGWQLQPVEDEPKRMKYLRIQQECWKWFQKSISALKPIDALFLLGDVIDGTGHRSGGTELICTDRNQQIEMALKIIHFIGAPAVVIARGTPYHAGEQEDMEDQIAAQLNADPARSCKIGDHEWVEVNGVTFDLKHHIGSSSVPYTRLTAISRDALWNGLWQEAGYAPGADYLVRAHVHYSTGGWRFSGDKEVNFFTLPALQAMGTKFGAKRCSGTVDYGFHSMDITDEGAVSWRKHVAFIESQKASVLRL